MTEENLREKILEKAKEMYESGETKIKVIEFHSADAGKDRITGRGIIPGTNSAVAHEGEIEIAFTSKIINGEILIDYLLIKEKHSL